MSKLIDENIWEQRSELLTEFECSQIARNNLESCSKKIKGYWNSKNDFYEKIDFVDIPVIELVSRAIGMNKIEQQSYRWIKLDFLLKVENSNDENVIEDEEIG
ncbi:MAG: hypothetical protein F6J93_26560 [Oscillatoria sp. SIO1A7]|nr:hypothetical protein [Oscillatoria sp. SIO1A7]